MIAIRSDAGYLKLNGRIWTWIGDAQEATLFADFNSLMTEVIRRVPDAFPGGPTGVYGLANWRLVEMSYGQVITPVIPGKVLV